MYIISLLIMWWWCNW